MPDQVLNGSHHPIEPVPCADCQPSGKDKERRDGKIEHVFSYGIPYNSMPSKKSAFCHSLKSPFPLIFEDAEDAVRDALARANLTAIITTITMIANPPSVS